MMAVNPIGNLFQPMIPPYGAPYAAVYAHGGVYAPPGVPVVSVHLFTVIFNMASYNKHHPCLKMPVS